MEIKPPGEFVRANVNIRDGDIITILDEGEYNKLPQDPSREVLTFKIKLPDGEKKKLSMNATSQVEIMKVYGKDSKNWIGKQFRVEIVRQKVFTQMRDVIFLYPVEKAPPIPSEELPPEEKSEK